MPESAGGSAETASRPDSAGGLVLIAGGTGFIGSAVTRKLASERPVAVLSRNAERARKRLSDGPSVDVREGDVTRPTTLKSALEGVETVVQCVQFPGFPVEAPSLGRTFMEVDARGTEALVAAAVEAGTRKVVYLSGVGADPDSSRTWFRAKGIAEAAVSSSGLDWSIVRPSWTYGPGDSSLNRFVDLIRRVPFAFPQLGPGRQEINPVFIDDVGRLVAACVTTTAGDGGKIEIGGRETMTIDAIIERTMKQIGVAKPIVHVPVELAQLGATVAELLPGQLLSRGAVEFVTQSAIADLTELDARFPDFELTPFENAIATYL